MIPWHRTIRYLPFVLLVVLGLVLIIGVMTPQFNWFVALVGAVIASLLVSIVFARKTDHLLQPYHEVAVTAEEIAKGNQSIDALPNEQSEIGQLARSLRRVMEKRQRQSVKRNRETDRLMTVLTYMADGVFILTRKGKLRLINPAACRMFSTSEGEAMQRTFAQVVRDHQIIGLLERCMESGEEEADAFELADDRFIRMVVTPFIKGAARGFLVILQDLTRMRNLQTMRRDFVSNVSHELRTPLASLRALAETLQDGAIHDPPAAERFLDRMGIEIEKLTQMVQELLELSKIESGQLPLDLQPVPAYHLITTSVERLQPQAERAGLDLALEVSDNLPNIHVDTNRIQQVMINLVHNAIKFTPPEGRITVSAGAANGHVTIAVTDTGEGIPLEDLPRIFERFYKTDRARSGGGSGLGLAISKHIVLAHKGDIWAESIEGKGSTFYCSLPTYTDHSSN